MSVEQVLRAKKDLFYKKIITKIKQNSFLNIFRIFSVSLNKQLGV